MKIPERKTAKFVCPHCQKDTKHLSITHGRLNKAPKRRRREEVTFEQYELMECQECKNLTLAVETHLHPGPGIGDAYMIKTKYYPPIPVRKKPQWLDNLDKILCALLEEVYMALDNSLYNVASTGLRTILDRVIVDKIGDAGSFDTKLRDMERNGLIDSEERDILSTVLDAGSAAAHRGFTPKRQTVEDMLDVLEEMLHKIYIAPKRRVALKAKAQTIKSQVPPRKKATIP
jgi:hypothetical protein